MSSNDGFKDQRSKAELLLSPAKPAGRTVINSGSLVLKLGQTASPGALTNPSQITGAIRDTLKGILQYKSQIAFLTNGLGGVLTKFDSLQASFNKGNLIQKDPLFRSSSSAALPNASEFFDFSTLTPGQPTPSSFRALIASRKKQLQAFSARISSALNSVSLSGVQIQENYNRIPNPQTENIDKPSTPKLAQGGSAGTNDAIYQDKMKAVVRGVPVGTGKPGFWGRDLSAASVAATPSINTVVNQQFKDTTNKGTWSEPASPYAAQFPYNHVQQSESGHVIEIDDTPHAERIHIFHRSGSFIEWHPDGTVVYKNMKHSYSLTMADQFVKVAGNCQIAVDGDASIYARGDVHVQSEKDIAMQAKGDFNVYAQNINMRAKKTFKADGVLIDLRYIKLPGSIMPYFVGPGVTTAPSGQFGPKVDLSAISADFPEFDPHAASAGNTPSGFTPSSDNVKAPPQSPLANPFIYAKQTPEAVNYRAKLFDTPDEVGNFEQYSSHNTLQQTLGDHNGSVKELGGSLRQVTTTVVAPTNKPTVNLLSFDDYKGKFNYNNTDAIANTSFTVQDLVDTHIHSSVMAEDMSTPMPPPPQPAPAPQNTFPDPPSGWEDNQNYGA